MTERAVRDKDAFDVKAATAWLRTHAQDPTGLDAAPEVRQFSGGASNLTYLLRFRSSDGPGRDLILRRAPAGTKARGAHDMRREFTIQSALAPVFPYVAPMVAFCDDESVIGSDFYVMERIDGVIPRSTWPDGVTLTPEQARQLCFNVVDVYTELHRVEPQAAGLASLGKGTGYVRRQVDGWSTRYRNAHTPDNPDFVDVMAWLDQEQPDDVANCVIHNDFKIDNMVFAHDDPTRVIGVLDWEMATVGDPLMDVAGALAFWIQADDSDELKMTKRVPTDAPGMITRAEFVEAYCERMGFDMTPQRWRFYEVFGLFRNAVIAQQIYYRYFHGQTSNEMYALFGPGVQILERRIQEVLA